MILGSIGSVGMWSVVIILPTIQAEFEVDRATASIPYTLTMVGFALGNVIAGRFVDRWGIMWPMIMAGLASQEAKINAKLADQKALDAERARQDTQQALGEVEQARGLAEQNLVNLAT